MIIKGQIFENYQKNHFQKLFNLTDISFCIFFRLLIQPYFIKEKKDFADGLYYNSYAIVEILNDKAWAEKNSDEIDNLRAPVYPLFSFNIFFI